MNRRGLLGSLCTFAAMLFVPHFAPKTVAAVDWTSDQRYMDPDNTLRHGDTFTIAGDPTIYTVVDPFNA